MRKNKGFSLVEMMIALLISTILFLAFFSIVSQFQIWSSNLNLLMERDANVWLAPLLLSRWITPAGNNRWNQNWSGVAVQTGRIEINSDIHGPQGFPDSELSASFEALVLQCSKSNLRVKSGSGSFQPLIKNIADFEVDSDNMPLISVRLKAVTDRPLFVLTENLSDSTEFLFFLRNYRLNLFSEDPR